MPPDEQGDGSQALAQMPRYKCHKEVSALQIDSINETTIRFVEGHTYGPKVVDKKMFARYTPVPGDYYVVYADGYESFSPKKAFEEGYTRG